VEPRLFGSQAERRRYLKAKFVKLPGFPLATFLWHYVVKMGFLDGKPGLIYCGLKGIQRFHSKAKLYELQLQEQQSPAAALPPPTGAPAPAPTTPEPTAAR
jgi:hypothetical protein